MPCWGAFFFSFPRIVGIHCLAFSPFYLTCFFFKGGRGPVAQTSNSYFVFSFFFFPSSSCAITYYLATHPEAQRKLHAELDEALGPCVCPNADLKASVNELKADVAPYDAVKALPYLE